MNLFKTLLRKYYIIFSLLFMASCALKSSNTIYMQKNNDRIKFADVNIENEDYSYFKLKKIKIPENSNIRVCPYEFLSESIRRKLPLPKGKLWNSISTNIQYFSDDVILPIVEFVLGPHWSDSLIIIQTNNHNYDKIKVKEEKIEIEEKYETNDIKAYYEDEIGHIIFTKKNLSELRISDLELKETNYYKKLEEMQKVKEYHLRNLDKDSDSLIGKVSRKIALSSDYVKCQKKLNNINFNSIPVISDFINEYNFEVQRGQANIENIDLLEFNKILGLNVIYFKDHVKIFYGMIINKSDKKAFFFPLYIDTIKKFEKFENCKKYMNKNEISRNNDYYKFKEDIDRVEEQNKLIKDNKILCCISKYVSAHEREYQKSDFGLERIVPLTYNLSDVSYLKLLFNVSDKELLIFNSFKYLKTEDNKSEIETCNDNNDISQEFHRMRRRVETGYNYDFDNEKEIINKSISNTRREISENITRNEDYERTSIFSFNINASKNYINFNLTLKKPKFNIFNFSLGLLVVVILIFATYYGFYLMINLS
ncbi:MAG: hypothetical protein GY830_04765 [Bacteroidetes bacterium]|nr:hypothetical protein [Bacteroidota bacterium]